MSKVTFTGPWNAEEQQQVRTLLTPVLSEYPDVSIECFYRMAGVPYKANVEYRGSYFGPVAYGPDILVENIRNCLPTQ